MCFPETSDIIKLSHKKRSVSIMFIVLAGGMLIIIIAVVVAVVSSVVSAVAADVDDTEV